MANIAKFSSKQIDKAAEFLISPTEGEKPVTADFDAISKSQAFAGFAAGALRQVGSGISQAQLYAVFQTIFYAGLQVGSRIEPEFSQPIKGIDKLN